MVIDAAYLGVISCSPVFRGKSNSTGVRDYIGRMPGRSLGLFHRCPGLHRKNAREKFGFLRPATQEEYPGEVWVSSSCYTGRMPGRSLDQYSEGSSARMSQRSFPKTFVTVFIVTWMAIFVFKVIDIHRGTAHPGVQRHSTPGSPEAQHTREKFLGCNPINKR